MRQTRKDMLKINFKKIKLSRSTIYLIIASLLLFHVYNFTSFGAADPVRTDISVHVANNMINNNTGYPDLLVLDVRTIEEFNTKHLYNATLIPLAELEGRLSELASYNDTEIIVYCRSGVRSLQASNILVANNFSKIFNMLGGIDVWIDVGFDYWTPPTSPNGDPEDSIDFGLSAFLVSLIGVIFVLALIHKKKLKSLRNN